MAVGRIVALSAAGVMLLAACGGDDAGSDDAGNGDGRSQEYVEAVVASMREDDETPLHPERVDCAAAAIVDVVGVDTLTDAGISPEELAEAGNLASLDVDLPDDAGDRLGNAFAECDLGRIEEVLIDDFTSIWGTELSSEAAGCLRDNLDDRAVTDALASAFVDGSIEQMYMQGPLASAVAACPPVMTEVLLAQTPSDLPPAAEACVSDFVEGNADLVVQGLTSGSGDAGQELGDRLAAACPDVATAPSG